jgi:hypothetical protein
MWLIPAAISVLIAAHLNRKSFSEAQMTSLRYICLATIYVSSTADIFINGVAQSPWLPLSAGGVVARGSIRGYDFSHSRVSLPGRKFSVAGHRDDDQLCVGQFWLDVVMVRSRHSHRALIITTFAIFEKKRADVLRVVDELRDWKG